MQRGQIETQLLEGCRRLAGKGFFHTPKDSFSMRIPGHTKMILISGHDWAQIDAGDLRAASFSATDSLGRLHGSIYKERGDVGAVAISSPKGVRMLASEFAVLPPIFDEQVRHIGSSGGSLKDEEELCADTVRKVFRQGANAALIGERLLCLGMTCDRVVFNTELYEKCAQAYVIAKASDRRISAIPLWVRLIANRRLLKDERRAAASYRAGRIPEGLNAY